MPSFPRRMAASIAVFLSIGLTTSGSVLVPSAPTVTMTSADASGLALAVAGSSPSFPHADVDPVPHLGARPAPPPKATCIGHTSPYRTTYPADVCTLDQAAGWVQRVWKTNGWGAISLAHAKQIIAGKVAARPAPRPTPAPVVKPVPRTATSTSLPAGISAAARAVIMAAVNHLGAPYVFGATGPTTFDCSGLVWYAFRSTGHFAIIGNGAYRRGRDIYQYFASRGLASRTDGRPGDIVAYDGGMHLGIYLGNGRVISALTRGVATHGLYDMSLPFTAFLHTGLDG